jgi:hypothetical protein
MKNLIVLVLFISFSISGYSQKSKKLAKTIESYVEMYQNPKILMVRSHQDFVDSVKRNAKLKKYFSDKNFLMEFLTNMKFSKDGLIALKLGKYADNKGFLLEVSGILGFEQSLFGNKKGYYCAGAGTCRQDAGGICITRNCTHAPAIGDRFNVEKVMASR